MNSKREDACAGGESGADEPDGGVTAGGFDQQAAHPGTEEAADLMSDHAEAVQRCELFRTELPANDSGCGRHGGISGKSQQDHECIDGENAFGQQQKQQDHDGPCAIQTSQHGFVAESAAKRAHHDGTGDRKNSVKRESVCGNVLRKAVAGDLCVEVGLNDCHMEAAGEKGQGRMAVFSVSNSLGKQGFDGSVLMRKAFRLHDRADAFPRQPDRQRNDQSGWNTENPHGDPDSMGGNQLLDDRSHHTGCDSVCGTQKTGDSGRILLGKRRGNGAHHHTEAQSRRTDGQDRAQKQQHHEEAAADGGADQTGDHEQRAQAQNKCVGFFQSQHAKYRLEQAVKQLRKGQNQTHVPIADTCHV